MKTVVFVANNERQLECAGREQWDKNPGAPAPVEKSTIPPSLFLRPWRFWLRVIAYRRVELSSLVLWILARTGGGERGSGRQGHVATAGKTLIGHKMTRVETFLFGGFLLLV